MHLFSVRRLPLAAVLLQLVVLVCNAESVDEVQEDIINENAAAKPSGFADHSDSRHSYNDPLDTNDLIERALSILRPLDESKRKQLHEESIWSAVVGRYLRQLIPQIQISGPSNPSDESASRRGSVHSGALAEGRTLLTEAAEHGNIDAMAILAEMSFFGNFTCPRNMGDAFARYSDLATNCDNGTFHHMLGFMYATGIGGATKRDTAKALLHHTVAAQAGNTQSQMTLGYRYLAGVGVTPSCEVARSFYKSAAEKAVGWYRSGPVGGKQWMSGQLRLADEKGGVYGGGASVSSSGYNAKQKGTIHDGSVEDMIEYLEMMVSKGEHKATLHLGIVYYDGQRGLAPNHVLARKYFQSVAGQYWARDGTAKDVKDQPGLEKQAAKAAGYLGRMYLRGESVEANHTKALEWFKRGVALGDASSQYGNGLMVLHGLGTEQNAERAAAMFSAASDQQYHPAQVELGKLYLDQGTSEDLLIAQRYFEVAARYQNIEAQYYLAEMASMGLGEERLCSTALAYYKSVAEKADPFTSSLTEANEVYHAGDRELALIEYMMAAEQGYEVGQSNAAYLVDNQKSMLELPALHSSHQSNSSILHNDNLALLYWTRSAKQSNIDSLVKMGDYYLDGIGTEPDADKAAACYTAASDYSQSAQAFYNLGWMHENGVSLTQDFHLAKRFYDRALHTNTEAYLPVKLSLLKLRLRSAWNTLTHGKINSIHDEPAISKSWSFWEWIANFMEEDRLYYESDDRKRGEVSNHDDSPMPGGDDGMYEDVDTIEDGVVESFLIIAVAAAIVWLIYYRQQRQLAADNRNRQAVQGANGQGAQAQDGFFPPVGDPARAEWVAGGIGH